MSYVPTAIPTTRSSVRRNRASMAPALHSFLHMGKPIGYAVVGLGDIARTAILPAFAAIADSSRLVAVVSSDRPRAQALAAQFGATAYQYDELRQCLQRDDVNAVYLTLPNSMHCDYTVEVARAGVHVLCEPPMAVTADECRRMIRTCQTNRVKLMIASRLPFQPAHRKALELVRGGQIGLAKSFSSDFALLVDDPGDARLQRRLGGGTMYELGVACIHTARTLFEAEPAQVMAMTARAGRRPGGDVEDGVVALIRFPDERLAHLHTSFGEESENLFTVSGDEGYLRLDPAYEHGVPMRMAIVRKGERQEVTFEPIDPFAAMLGYFSTCVREDRSPQPSGIDGLNDVRIVEAIYRSARDGRPVTLPRVARMDESPGQGRSDGDPLDKRRVG